MIQTDGLAGELEDTRGEQRALQEALEGAAAEVPKGHCISAASQKPATPHENAQSEPSKRHRREETCP